MMTMHARVTRATGSTLVVLALGLGMMGAGAATASPALASPDAERPSAGPGLRLPDGPATVGRWSVRADDAGLEPQLVWRSRRPLPLTDARPELRVGDRVVALPTVTPDGRGLTVPLGALAGIDTRRLEVWLGADRLDRAGRTTFAAQVPGGQDAFADPDVLTVDPARPGSFEVGAEFDYSADALPWSEFNRSMEVLGHAVLPAGVDDAPLVLFLHGRHSVCYRPAPGEPVPPFPSEPGQWDCPGPRVPIPSFLGYDYIQQRLATQGYASVSISANAINALDFASPDGGAAARSALVRHHLGLLQEWAADPSRPRWYQRVDLGRTVLVGHSRGGEGVATASVDRPADAPWTVLGQVLVAPTNFARRATPYTPAVTMLPYCDGDVFDLQGQQYTDLPRDLTADDTSLFSSVLMRGANHNFFNTEWTPGVSLAPSWDDWFDKSDPLCGADAPTRLSAAEQRAAGRAWIAAAVHVFVDGDTDALPALDSAGPITVPSAPASSVLTEAIGGDRTLIRPGPGAGPTGAGTLCRATGAPHASLPRCSQGVRTYRGLHWSQLPVAVRSQVELRLRWRSPDVGGGVWLDDPVDLSGPDTTLDLRLVVDPTISGQRARIRLTDADGDSWATEPRSLRPLPGNRFLRAYFGQTLRVDPARAPDDLDLTAIRGVALQGVSAEGQVWLLDAAARRPGLLPVPDERAPEVSLGPRVVVTEGDSDGSVEMTYALDAPSPRPVRFTVAVADDEDDLDAVRVRVPAGVTDGTVEVQYEGDRVDDPDRRTIWLGAYAERGVVVDDGTSTVVVVDDDPDARMSARVARSPVRAGQPMVWVLRLDRPTDYTVFWYAQGVVSNTTRPPDLRVSDVPADWARRHLGRNADPRAPVASEYYPYGSLRAGDRVARIVVPTRKHPARPGPRVLTLRLFSPLLPGDEVVRSIRRR